MISFVVEHAWDILLTVVEVIIGVGTAYFYRREERRNENSVMRERANRARDELLDIVESRIISDQDVSEELIHTLLKALEREYRVTLSDNCSRTELLQDVALRLQKSRHLSKKLKSKYTTRIEQMISTETGLHGEII